MNNPKKPRVLPPAPPAADTKRPGKPLDTGKLQGGYVDDLSVKCTQKMFGEIVGISQPAVSDLIARGVIVDGDSLGGWLSDYCAHLREIAAGRAANGDLDLATERAALARAQRLRIEMQNDVTRGELAPVVQIEEVLTKTASKIAGIFDAIPGGVRRRFPELSSETIDLIAAEVARARNTVASMSLADLADDDDQAEAKDLLAD